MNDFKTTGLVCKIQKIGESDRLLTVLTRDMGVIHVFAAGANSLKSKKQAATQLLCFSDFTIVQKKDAYRVKEVELIQMFRTLSNNIEKFTLSQYFCEVACLLAPADEGAEDYLRLALNSIAYLENSKYPDFQIKAVFELFALTMGGFMPDLTLYSGKSYADEELYLDCINGQLVPKSEVMNDSCVYVSQSVLRAIVFILSKDFRSAFGFTLSEKELERLKFVCETYLTSQLERSFNSLRFYNGILRGNI